MGINGIDKLKGEDEEQYFECHCTTCVCTTLLSTTPVVCSDCQAGFHKPRVLKKIRDIPLDRPSYNTKNTKSFF